MTYNTKHVRNKKKNEDHSRFVCLHVCVYIAFDKDRCYAPEFRGRT